MALYDTLFAMMDLQASQLLVTPRDFRDENFKINLRETTEELLSVARVIPVFNENDAISDRSKDAVGLLLLPLMQILYLVASMLSRRLYKQTCMPLASFVGVQFWEKRCETDIEALPIRAHHKEHWVRLTGHLHVRCACLATSWHTHYCHVGQHGRQLVVFIGNVGAVSRMAPRDSRTMTAWPRSWPRSLMQTCWCCSQMSMACLMARQRIAPPSEPASPPPCLHITSLFLLSPFVLSAGSQRCQGAFL